jgi:hypothetical protein|eukprot:COSAG02_NODE_3854_length_6142_cov_8.420817_3_plen_347_part_00
MTTFLTACIGSSLLGGVLVATCIILRPYQKLGFKRLDAEPYGLTTNPLRDIVEADTQIQYEKEVLSRMFQAWYMHAKHPTLQSMVADMPHAPQAIGHLAMVRHRLHTACVVQFDRGPLGMDLIETHHPSLADFGMVEVSHIEENGPAALGGVREGHLLTDANEHDILGHLSQGRLADVLRMTKARPIKLTFARSPHDFQGRDRDQAQVTASSLTSVQDVFTSIDEDKSGRVSYLEFAMWWVSTSSHSGHTTRHDQEQILALFKDGFDLLQQRDHVDSLSSAQLREVLVAVAADDWVEMKDQNNHPFYFNKQTKASSWHDPGGAELQEGTVLRFLRESGFDCATFSV